MRKLTVIVLMVCGSFLARSQSVTIQWSNENQTIEGFGASDAWLADDIQKHAKANEIMDIFFKPGAGIELSILRQRISPRPYNSSGQWDWSHKDFVGSSWVAKAARNRGVSKIWASCWTAPKWMKTNNIFNNGGFLVPDKYDDHAEFLSGWVQRMKSTQGITYYGISAQNEPGEKPWESMEWTKNDYKKFIKDDLIPAMNRKGLGGVKIMYPESTGWKEMDNWDLNSSDVQNNVDIFCGHNYGRGNDSRDYTGYGKPVWHTEWWTEQQTGITGGLSLAENMHKYLTLANVNTWHYWWLATNQPGKSNGLISLTSNSDYKILKNFYVSGQFSKFIKPGWKRVGTTNHNPAPGIYVSAYKNGAGNKITIVAINKNNSNKTLALNFDGFETGSISRTRTSPNEDLARISNKDGGSSASLYLAPKSITTFSASVTQKEGNSNTWYRVENEGRDWWLQASDNNDEVYTASQNFAGDFTQWKKVSASSGWFYLENKGTGERLKDESDVPIMVTAASAGNWVQWREVDAGNGYKRLQNRGTGQWLQASGTSNSTYMVPTTYNGAWTKWRFVTVGSSNSRTASVAEKSPWTERNITENTIRLYPNPASQTVAVHLSNSDSKALITVTDLTGREMFHQRQQGSSEVQLSVQSLPRGLYHVRVQQADQVIVRKLLVE